MNGWLQTTHASKLYMPHSGTAIQRTTKLSPQAPNQLQGHQKYQAWSRKINRWLRKRLVTWYSRGENPISYYHTCSYEDKNKNRILFVYMRFQPSLGFCSKWIFMVCLPTVCCQLFIRSMLVWYGIDFWVSAK